MRGLSPFRRRLSLDGKAVWLLTVPANLPHFRISGFQFLPEPVAIGQRRLIARDFLAYRHQPRGVVRQFSRQALIGFEIGRDQFGQVDRLQQAGGNPGGKGLAPAGDERQSGP